MKVPAALPGIAIIVVLVLGGLIMISSIEKAANTYHVVKSGDCYTYKSSTGWISNTCHSTYAEAEADMQSLIDFKAREEAHENRDWKAVTE